jgi:hypothetical protein
MPALRPFQSNPIGLDEPIWKLAFHQSTAADDEGRMGCRSQQARSPVRGKSHNDTLLWKALHFLESGAWAGEPGCEILDSDETLMP